MHTAGVKGDLVLDTNSRGREHNHYIIIISARVRCWPSKEAPSPYPTILRFRIRVVDIRLFCLGKFMTYSTEARHKSTWCFNRRAILSQMI